MCRAYKVDLHHIFKKKAGGEGGLPREDEDEDDTGRIGGVERYGTVGLRLIDFCITQL